MRILIVVAMLVATSAHADDRTPVSLHDVVEAVRKAPAARVGGFEISAAEAGIDAAGAWPLPAVRVAHNTLTAKLTAGVTLPLPVFGTIGAARRRAAAEMQVVRAETDVALRSLRHRAVQAWVRLARAGSDVEAATVNAQQASELEVIAQGRLSAGVGADVDVTVAAAARARATMAVARAERDEDAASAELAGLLGWDPLRRLRADGALDTNRQVASLDRLRARLPQHPERIAAEHRVSSAQATLAETRAARWPVVAVEGEVLYDDPTNDHKTDTMVGLAIDLPLFQHLGDKLRVARALEAAQRARLAATETELDAGLVAAYRKWQAAVDTLTTLDRDVMPAQERAATLSATAYREGARDLASALQAERDLSAVRAERNAALADAAAAYADLQLAIGDEAGDAN